MVPPTFGAGPLRRPLTPFLARWDHPQASPPPLRRCPSPCPLRGPLPALRGPLCPAVRGYSVALIAVLMVRIIAGFLQNARGFLLDIRKIGFQTMQDVGE